jgi:ubiquinone/menaquinone biosynthesis C-methylase UbiE
MNKEYTWTGERLETFITNEVMLEHLHRYAIAMEFTKGKKVLDIACGEGYGVNLLAINAAHITGIDIDNITIEKAKNKYKAGNITFKTGSVLEIPAENNSYDVITCFETLEHTSHHDKMLSELKRVLAPSGLLFISTPEKRNYSDTPNHKNPFHEKELYGNEFKDLLSRFFGYSRFYEQSSFVGSIIIDENKEPIQRFFTGNYNSIQATPSITTMYWLAIASDSEVPVLSSSLFRDQNLISRILNEQAEALKKTKAYRTGNFILAPFKFILSLFRK